MEELGRMIIEALVHLAVTAIVGGPAVYGVACWRARRADRLKRLKSL